MQPLTGPYVYGVNRRSENFLLFCQIYFLREDGVPEADINVRILCCFGLSIQFYDVLEGDIYRCDQD